MSITIVKKVKSDGCLCRKSAEVWSKLESARLLSHIDRIVFARERDLQSEGMSLAIEHRVDAAPFFIVEEDGVREVYTDYDLFLQEVIGYLE